MKLKQKDLPAFRDKLLKKQRGKCGLCKQPLCSTEANLDHCHKSGRNRAAVHRECNILLGKVENYINRYGKRFKDSPEMLKGFFKNVLRYMEKDYSHLPYHPKHKLPKDKKIKELQRRYRNAKRTSTKERLARQIKNLGGTLPRGPRRRPRTRK